MPKKEFDLLTFGEILLRLSPVNHERLLSEGYFERHVGGAELNVAAGAALLGLSSGMISRIPDNNIGLYASNQARKYGVSVDYLIYDKSKDARLGIYYYENGASPRKPGVIYDRMHTSINNIDIVELPDNISKKAVCFHTSGITLALSEASRKAGYELIKQFKRVGAVISFDVNYRSNLWSGDEARRCIETILPYVDIFFCSEDTARLTFQRDGDVKNIIKGFAEDFSIQYVASTQRIVHSPKSHSFGSIIFDAAKDRYYTEEPYKEIEIVDRIGSGDAYVAGVLYGLLSEGGDCFKALQYGNACSAVKNTVPGDLPSFRRREIESLIKEHSMNDFVNEMER